MLFFLVVDLPVQVPGLNVERRWYVGKLERTVCETAVRACMQGDYLIRKSASSSGYVLCINDSGQSIAYYTSSLRNIWIRDVFFSKHLMCGRKARLESSMKKFNALEFI